jgi:tetratricopeptide (TPR) repeat protein
MRGVPFDRLERQAADYLELLERYGLREPLSAVQAILRTIDVLKNSRPGDPAPHSAPPEQEFGSRHIGHYALLVKMQEQYLFGDYEAAIETGKRSAQYLGDSRGMLHGTEHPFWLALAQFAQARHAQARHAGQKEIRRFERWAQGSPANFAARALILRGEGASIAGKSDAALAAFGQAAQIAAEYHQPHLAGLAHRLRAAEFARRGRTDDQARHLALAAEQYRLWGAEGLAAQLQDLPGHDLSTRSVSA